MDAQDVSPAVHRDRRWKSIHYPDLISEKRAKMKILLLDAGKDIPVKKIDMILKEMLALYK